MDAQTLEARIALAQMDRYLAGEDFPPEALGELEKVLKSNPVCVAELNRRKEELMDPVAAVDTAHVETPASTPAAPVPAGRGDWKAKILSLIKPADGNPKTTKMRTVALSVGLGVVLIAMSAIMRDPTGLLGPRADASFAAAPSDETDPVTPLEGEVLGEEDRFIPAEDASGTPETPDEAQPEAELPLSNIVPEPMPEPQSETMFIAEGNEIRQEEAPVQPAPTRRPAAPRRPGTGSIRVYDENGKPINP